MNVNSKKNRQLINILSFVFAIILGITAGVFLGNGGDKDAQNSPIESDLIEIDPLQTNNSNGLLLGVDDVNLANPSLESAWWFSYDQSKQELFLMPLYPILPLNAPENLLPYLAPHAPIEFPSSDLTIIGEQSILSSYNISWDFTFMMDRIALEKMLANYSALSTDASQLKIEYLNSLDPTSPGEDPSAALSYQRKLFEILCEDPAPILSDSWIDDLIDLSGNYQSDLSFTEILMLREDILDSNSSPTCKFSWQ